jgi:hypothetical protein
VLAYKAASQNFHLVMLLQVLKIRICKAEIHVEGFPALGPILYTTASVRVETTQSEEKSI